MDNWPATPYRQMVIVDPVSRSQCSSLQALPLHFLFFRQKASFTSKHNISADNIEGFGSPGHTGSRPS